MAEKSDFKPTVHILYYIIMYVFTDVKLDLNFLKLYVISMLKH